MPASPAHCVVLDVGGQSVRAVALDRAGKVLALVRRALGLRTPRPGWFEQDPAAMLAAVRGAVAAIAQRLDLAAGTPLGLACQRASIVCWDRQTGLPLSPVIGWQDTRAAELLEAAALDLDAVQARTGMRPSAYLGASKLAWCWRHRPQVRRAARAGRLGWGPLASYLIQALTAERAYRCPASLAQRTLLFDPVRMDWDRALCEAFGIEAAWLPEPVPDLAELGRLAGQLRLPLGLCAGDQNLLPAAVALRPDEAVLNLGTGAFVLAGADGDDARLQRSVLPGPEAPPRQVLEATVHGAAMAFAWWRERSGGGAGCDPPPSDADTPHFLDSVGGLGSPWWRHGVAPRFSRPPASQAQGLAAVADGLVHLLYLNLERLRARGLAGRQLWVGGGLARADGLLQRLADLAGVEVLRPRCTELSVRGAAVLLGCDPLTERECDRVQPGAADAARERYRRWCAWVEDATDLRFA